MDVFISHSAADEKFARELASELNRRRFTAWSDAEVLPGDNWATRAGKALENSEAMVLLLSPDWVKSPRLSNDLQYALGSPRYEGRVIGLVIRPTREIPWILEHLHLILKTDAPEKAANEVVRFLTRKREVAGR